MSAITKTVWLTATKPAELFDQGLRTWRKTLKNLTLSWARQLVFQACTTILRADSPLTPPP